MNISDETLNQLFKSLKEYNPTTNAVMEKIAIAMQLFGMVIVLLLFLVELQDTSRKFNRDDGGMTIEVLLNIAAKYLVAWVCIMMSSQLVDGIVWFFIQMSKWIHSLLPLGTQEDIIPGIAKANWFQKGLLFMFQILAYIAIALASLVTKVLIFLRGMQLYILKALAPVLIAFFVSEEMKQTAMGWLKQVLAYALQGALLILILGLIPTITKNDFLATALNGPIWEHAGKVVMNIITYFTLILKYIAILVLLIGSQNLAKRLIGAM
ncbi:TPA: type IV secretion system protein [Enterococcus faecalis]|nr:type IV secretion system protein [Enterococcus faecalis]